MNPTQIWQRRPDSLAACFYLGSTGAQWVGYSTFFVSAAAIIVWMATPSCRISNCQPSVGLGNGEGNALGRGILRNRKKSGTEVARLPVTD